MFCSLHGLSGLTSLRNLHIDANLDHIPDMLRQIDSPRLEHIIIEASPYMLDAAIPEVLARAIYEATCTKKHPARMVSFVCTPDMAQSQKPDFEALPRMRDRLLQVEVLKDLHKQRKLHILRRVQCPISGWASWEVESL